MVQTEEEGEKGERRRKGLARRLVVSLLVSIGSYGVWSADETYSVGDRCTSVHAEGQGDELEKERKREDQFSFGLDASFERSRAK